MTITAYLREETLIESLQKLNTIFKAEKPEFVEPLAKFMTPLDLSFTVKEGFNIVVQLSLVEFSLVGIYIKSS